MEILSAVLSILLTITCALLIFIIIRIIAIIKKSSNKTVESIQETLNKHLTAATVLLILSAIISVTNILIK